MPVLNYLQMNLLLQKMLLLHQKKKKIYDASRLIFVGSLTSSKLDHAVVR